MKKFVGIEVRFTLPTLTQKPQTSENGSWESHKILYLNLTITSEFYMVQLILSLSSVRIVLEFCMCICVGYLNFILKVFTEYFFSKWPMLLMFLTLYKLFLEFERIGH